MAAFKRLGIFCLLIALLIVPQHMRAQSPGMVRLTLEKLGYSDLLMQGMYGVTSAFVSLPSNWVISQDTQVNVKYVASPIAVQARSTLTVMVNDQALYSLRPITDGTEHSFTFYIPPKLMTKNQGVLLRFQGFLRLTSETCEETNNAGQWLKIRSQTELLLNAQEDITDPPLDKLTNAIVIQSAVDAPPPIVFVLPEQWNSSTLTTAARIATRLGKGITGKPPSIKIVKAHDLTTSMKREANLVVIGNAITLPNTSDLFSINRTLATPGNVPVDASTPTLAPPTLRPGEGYIKIIRSPWNPARKILLVAGTTEHEIEQAGAIFAASERFALLRGPEKSIPALVNAPVVGEQKRPWTTNKTTLADLGATDRIVSGTGVFNEYYGLRLPDGWVLEPGAQLTLNVVASPVLQPEQSYVSVYVNDIFVGNVALKEPGKEVQVSLPLPVDRLQVSSSGQRSQRFLIRVSVANTLQLSYCEELHADAIWTRINANSFLSTPHTYLPWPDLQAFPYPFLNNPDEAPIVIAVPPNPDEATLSDAAMLAALFGQFAITDFNISMVTADQLTQARYADANLIVLGPSSDQPFVERLTALMTPALNEDVIAAFKNPDFGILREAVSPWNPQRAVLLVFSASGTGYRNAFQALINTTPPVTQSGAIAAVEVGQPPRIIYRAPRPTATPTQSALSTASASSAVLPATSPSTVIVQIPQTPPSTQPALVVVMPTTNANSQFAQDKTAPDAPLDPSRNAVVAGIFALTLILIVGILWMARARNSKPT